jgi:hypothetical protein
MKSVMIAASAVMILSGVATASAQSEGPTYSNTIHQSAGDRDSRGTPKYYQPAPHQRTISSRHSKSKMSTTGAGSSSGPFYDNSIHQSAGDRDSRGTPKYNQEK